MINQILKIMRCRIDHRGILMCYIKKLKMLLFNNAKLKKKLSNNVETKERKRKKFSRIQEVPKKEENKSERRSIRNGIKQVGEEGNKQKTKNLSKFQCHKFYIVSYIHTLNVLRNVFSTLSLRPRQIFSYFGEHETCF